MSTWEITQPPGSDSRLLKRCAALALFLEFTLITAMGWHVHWLSHPQKTNDDDRFIQAEMVQLPTRSHLVEEKAPTAPPAPKEKAISKAPGQGKSSAAPLAQPQENQTQSGPKFAPTHGPIALYAPAPAIPSYLQNQQLKASVVIDFYITAQGAVTPRLVGSSSNEELDAIALATAKKWQFRPAEKDHQPVDAKVRLRINFEVQ